MQDFHAAHAFAAQAALAAVGGLDAGRDEKILTHAACRLGRRRHREERSDVAIQEPPGALTFSWIASSLHSSQ